MYVRRCFDNFNEEHISLSSQGASGEANDKLASQMIFSLRGIMGSPAKTARLRLMAGKADPANPLSKFLMVLCKQPRGSTEVLVGEGIYVREKRGQDFEGGTSLRPALCSAFEACCGVVQAQPGRCKEVAVCVSGAEVSYGSLFVGRGQGNCRWHRTSLSA